MKLATDQLVPNRGMSGAIHPPQYAYLACTGTTSAFIYFCLLFQKLFVGWTQTDGNNVGCSIALICTTLSAFLRKEDACILLLLFCCRREMNGMAIKKPPRRSMNCSPIQTEEGAGHVLHSVTMQAASVGLVCCMIPEDSGEYSGMANSAPLYHRNCGY